VSRQKASVGRVGFDDQGKQMAKVDVVVPCYNYARFLERCVRSVLNQSVKDVRVLIIDDASSDESLLVARKLAQADPRVTVVGHAENRGHIDTYNEGIDWVSAEYCLLLSADDLLVPRALERAVGVMDANPDVVLTFGEDIQWHDHLPVPDIKSMQDYTWERHDLLKQLCVTTINIFYVYRYRASQNPKEDRWL
jgi:glycosyltransferase involved in cell wall biosynthesis